VLSDIAPGPDAEAVAVWRVAPRLPDGAFGRPGPDAWAIDAARGHYAGRGEVSFDAPEQVAPAGADGPPSVAIDPSTGNALAAWVSLAGGFGHVEYAVRAAESPASAAFTTGARGARSGGGGGWIAPAVAAALALALATGLLLGAARRPRGMRTGRG
jgi:hypothetical protein